MLVKKTPFPLWNKLNQKCILLKRLKQQYGIFNKYEMRNIKKRQKRLGVLFFSTFFDIRTDVVHPYPFVIKRMKEVKRLRKKKVQKFLQDFDYFCKNSSPRYERENQALFTTAFMQRGGDPLWS